MKSKMKQKIVKTALILFLEEGFFNVSMNNIADEIGVSKPAIYYHFKNKDDLIVGVMDYFSYKMKNWSSEYYKDCKTGKSFLIKLFKAIPILKNAELIVLGKKKDNKSKFTYNELLITFSKYKPKLKKRISDETFNARKYINVILEESKKT